MTTNKTYGLQRCGQWLAAEHNPPAFDIEPIWAAISLDQALEKALLIQMIHGLKVEPRRIP